jgi:hypothetical protein
MATINGVDFGLVAKEAIAAARDAADDDATWRSLKDIIKNITASLNGDVQLIAKRKLSAQFNARDAAVFLDDQKMLARMRIRSVAIIGLQLAERIWNAIAAVFGAAIRKALGWKLL